MIQNEIYCCGDKMGKKIPHKLRIVFLIVFCLIGILYILSYNELVIDNEFKIFEHFEEATSFMGTYKFNEKNSKCTTTKIDYRNKHALNEYKNKMMRNSVILCEDGEIALNDHIIQVEENVPFFYNGLDKLETYIFRLKSNRLREIYDLDYSKVSCSMKNISKVEGIPEGILFLIK